MRSPSEPSQSRKPGRPTPTGPPLTGRIHYLIGGLLPPAYAEWVRADLTGPGWRHRQASRPLLLMLPFALAFAVLPGAASVRVSIPLALLVCAVVMGYATSDSFRNRRLDQYGIPRPTPVEEDEPEADEAEDEQEVNRPEADEPGGRDLDGDDE